MEGKALAYRIANVADDKRAEDIVILEMKGISLIADYFLICHGNSEKQVQAIADEVKEAAAEQNIFVKRIEGYAEARWVLLDLGEIVVHIFHKDERSYYNLEKLWGDAPRLKLEENHL
ncbi:ribosome silencing factor [Pueribacillus theae]|uniref:Ribosomal silencing factor RsfS n=1 Tax=Pueribacillus theae TaxID=2171751 RepID=A0A2U1K6B5_9BACI|nr:ribosome silencing factor [Pueribacillus theae]PWA12503.1 ribosome silencing factor [Pueribacillus theae]